MKREEVLRKATDAVTSRNDREDTFWTIARLWTAYLEVPIDEADVCRMMALLKIARSKMGIAKEDSLVDCAGYMACCAEYVEEIELDEKGIAPAPPAPAE